MKKIAIVLGVVLLFVAALLAVGGFFLFRYMQDQARLALGPLDTEIVVQLSNPLNLSEWPQDTGVPVQTIARSTGTLTRLELWMDGALLLEEQVSGERPGSVVYTRWEWPPAATGVHWLQARAVDEEGNVAVSQTVRIRVTDPAGYNLLVPCLENETIAALIERLEVPAELIYGANPDFDPAMPDQPCEAALVPQPPEQPLEIASPAALAPPTNLQASNAASAASITDLSVPVNQQLLPPQVAPAAPGLYVQAAGCDVTLTIEDLADSETGFSVERLGETDDAPVQIAYLEANPGTGALIFTDTVAHGGTVQYTVSAFNVSGHSPSAPAMVEVDAEGCQVEEYMDLAEQIRRDIPSLAGQYNLAYFYYSTSSGYHRYPADPEVFLQPGEVANEADIGMVLAGLEAEQGTQIQSLDLWGWEGESLNQIIYDTPGSSTKLRICPDEKECFYDTNSIATIYESWDTTRVRKVIWRTEGLGWPHNNRLLFQLSDEPFDSNELFPPSLIHSWTERTYGNELGYIEFDIKDYLFANYGGTSQQSQTCLGSTCEDNKKYYLRAIPMLFDNIVSKPSNPVFLTVEPLGSEYRDVPPSIYGVEIIQYNEPLVPNPKYWGCVFINGDYQNGICPADLEEESDLEMVVTGIVDGVMAAWSYAIQAIDAAKNFVIDQVIALGELAAPGWCGETCRGRLMAGLNVAITALTGLPPNLPNFEQMAESGVEYVVQITAEEMGVPCEEECQEIIREGIMDAADAIANSGSTPSCNSAEAERRGKQAWCPSFPPGTLVEPAADGVYGNASIVVRVSHYEGGDPADSGKYTLAINSLIANTWMQDKYYLYCGYYDGTTTTSRFLVNTKNTEPLIGAPFRSQVGIPIPWIEPGGYVDIPINLPAKPYVIPDHMNRVRSTFSTDKWDTCIIDDWPYLYYGGLQTLEVEVRCENSLGHNIGCDQNTTLMCRKNVGSEWGACKSVDIRLGQNPTFPFWVNP